MSSSKPRHFTFAIAFLIALISTMSFGARRVSAKHISGVVNLNSASIAELDVLPGVGAKAAQKIVDYRKKAPFSRTEELVKVKGFGRKKYEKLKPYLTVSGPTTISSTSNTTQSTLRVTTSPQASTATNVIYPSDR